MSEVAAAGIAARIDRLPPTRAVWSLVILASLGGIFEFYDLFLTGYLAPSMVRSGLFTGSSLGLFAALSSLALHGIGTFVFCSFAGAWVGVMLFSGLIDRCGRRVTFTWSLAWYTACTTVMAFQRSGEALNLWRFVAGLGFGVQLVAIDTYITELIPFRERGRAFAANQFVTFCVVPVVALLSWLLVPLRIGGLDGWRIVILIGASGGAMVWLLRIGLPESPRWLALRGRAAEAEAVMSEIERRVLRETGLGRLPAILPALVEQPGTGRLAELFSPRYVERTLMLSIFNIAQVIGFYGFAAWVPSLLVARGVTFGASLEYSFIIAAANPLGPLIALLYADRIERRTQIILGQIGMALFMAAFSIASAPSLLIALGVLFNLSANVMSYAYHAYQAELFPTRIRARGAGFVWSWSRITAAFAGLAVGYFLFDGGVPALAVFIAVAMTIGTIIVTVFGPDTRARRLETINH